MSSVVCFFFIFGREGEMQKKKSRSHNSCLNPSWHISNKKNPYQLKYLNHLKDKQLDWLVNAYMDGWDHTSKKKNLMMMGGERRMNKTSFPIRSHSIIEKKNVQ